MNQLIASFVDALIPLGLAALLLVRPQAFTKKDLNAEENSRLAGTLRKIGFALLGAGVLILIANLMSSRK